MVPMNTVLLSAAALLTIGLVWLLHTLLTGAADSGGRPRAWQLVAAFALFAGAGALIAYLIR